LKELSIYHQVYLPIQVLRLVCSIFVKKREGKDVLETKIKIGKTQKETGRDYKFSKNTSNYQSQVL